MTPSETPSGLNVFAELKLTVHLGRAIGGILEGVDRARLGDDIVSSSRHVLLAIDDEPNLAIHSNLRPAVSMKVSRWTNFDRIAGLLICA